MSISSFVTLSQVRLNWELFNVMKTCPSSTSYFWMCIFEGIPFPAKCQSFPLCLGFKYVRNLDQLWPKKILSESSHYGWENFKNLSLTDTNKMLYPNWKFMLNFYIQGLCFLKGHFKHDKKLKRRGLCEQFLPETIHPLLASVDANRNVLCNWY